MTYSADELTDASFHDALDRLDAVRDSFTNRFLLGNVSIWAGSAISASRYPDLRQLLTKLLDTLFDLSADITDPENAERWTIDQIIKRSGVNRGDTTVRFSDWNDRLREEVINNLWDEYSAVLETRYAPKGKPASSLVWDVLKIDQIYDNPKVTPDAEHRFLALLVLEGVLTSLVTTNWDPLIEDAYAQAAVHTGAPALKVIVRPADIAHTGGQPSLIKMHGCARRARNDETARDYVVGTSLEIKGWANKREIEAVRNKLTDAARAFEVLYLGLSGQDLNIQQQHIEAGLFSDWDYLGNGPRVVFSHGDLDSPRDEILKAAYGIPTYNEHFDSIREDALVPLFAKPLLGALYAYVVRKKLRAFAKALPDPDLQRLAIRGVEAFFGHVGQLIDAVPASTSSPREVRRWRYLSEQGAQFVSSFITVYKRGKAVDDPWEYHPVSKDGTPDPEPSDYYLALVIGILVEGHNQGLWQLALVPDRAEQLTLYTPLGEEIPVFVTCEKMISAGPLIDTIPEPDETHLIIVAQGSDPGTRGSASPTTPLLSRLNPPKRVELYLEAFLDQSDPVVALHNELVKNALATPPPTTS